MNTHQINKELRHVRMFRGTFARDRLPKRLPRPFAIVVNTDSQVEAGEHWVAIYAPKKGRCEYFDPMGWPPPHKLIISYLNSLSKKFIYCCQPLQGATSNKCGRFCIAFIKARQTISYQNFINGFGWNFDSNDKKVSK